MKGIRRKIYTLFHTPNIFLKKFVGSPFMKMVPDKWALQLIYKSVFGKKLNLKNPQTFNEKLQWLKLYNRNPEYTRMVDKYAAKEYAASIIGDEYIIPTLGVWDKFEDINFDALPNQFVLKCTHGSGDVVICKDKSKFDLEAAKKKLKKSLKTNYYLISREWPYKNVPRKIIAEKYMESPFGGLNDYKFFCFNGEAKVLFIATNRDKGSELTRFDFYDMEFNPLAVENIHPNSNKINDKPEGFTKMTELAQIISRDLPFSRIDFYEINGKIYFGEITLFHAGGFSIFKPYEWDCLLGEWLQLPTKDVDIIKEK